MAIKFVLTSIGSAGDVYPMIALGKELQRRGHQVLLATNGHFRRAAEDNGLKFSELGTADDFKRVMGHPELWHPRKSFAYIFGYIKNVLPEQYRILVESQQESPTCCLASTLSFGAFNARESTGMPVFSVHLQPAVIWSYLSPPNLGGITLPNWFKRRFYDAGEKALIDNVVCPFLNPWREELGLPPVRKITRWWHSPDGVICPFPSWFTPPQQDWPTPLIQADFPLWNDPHSSSLPADYEEFMRSGSPPVVFTPGSANVHNHRFFQTAIKATGDLGERAILLSPYKESWPRHVPKHALCVPFIPLQKLLPHAKALIHHGGIGTMSQALLAGIPQIIKPLAHDQFDNAQRIKDLKLGGSIRESRFHPRPFRKVLRRVLEDSEIRSACALAKQRLAPMNGVAQIIDGVEELLKARNQPPDNS